MFQLQHGRFALGQHAQLDFYSVTSLNKQSTDRHPQVNNQIQSLDFQYFINNSRVAEMCKRRIFTSRPKGQLRILFFPHNQHIPFSEEQHSATLFIFPEGFAEVMQCVFKIIICTVCCYCSKFTLQITLFSLFTWFKQITLLSLFTWFKRTRKIFFGNIFSFKTDKLLFLNISITKYDNEFIFTRRLVMRVLDFTCNDPKCHDHSH